jgi:hypothetical protein
MWAFEPVLAKPLQSDPADPLYLLIDSLKSTNRDVADRNDPQPWPGHLYNLPEFYGYEHLSRGVSIGFRAETRAVTLDKLPMTLVEIVNTRHVSQNSISGERFWLDPKRGHMMVRKEQFHAAESDKSVGTSEVLRAARTPQGLWFPTTVRQIGNTISPEGDRHDSYLRYYLEFNTAIPDELFNAESVDAKSFWTPK